MGELSVKSAQRSEIRNPYLLQVLQDIKALDWMLSEGLFEKNQQRIGAEQELCLIDEGGSPTLKGPDILARMEDGHVTTEIGKYNLEINLDPFELRADCLRRTEQQLIELLSKVASTASEEDSQVLLTGILPSLTFQHIQVDSMTPMERYRILNETMRAIRGKDFEIHIIGVDEMSASLNSVLFEACNTSFQTHLQIDTDDFVDQYNWAQMIAGPMVAAVTNSPLLFGRELWMETRIALFQQSVDTRNSANYLREKQSRVYFGNTWLRERVSEVFKEHLARFPLIFCADTEENSLFALQKGYIPTLRALRLHNGSIYTWNRICYGINNAMPHLRIECRYIPSGPTVADEIANFAFWLGLLKGMPEAYKQLPQKVAFKSAKDNFYRAARIGLNASFDWFGKTVSSQDLLLRELLPIAQKGLEAIHINAHDINRYLNVIERRVATAQTGAHWQIRNYRKLKDCFNTGVSITVLAKEMYERQQSGSPIHEWKDIDCGSVYTLSVHESTVNHLMVTDLFTISEDEPLAFVKSIMEWQKIRHLPVEDKDGNLVGLITATNVKAFHAMGEGWELLPVKKVMVKNLVTISENTPLKTAIALLENFGIGCLLVVHDQKLIGIITDTDVKRLLSN